MNSTIIIYLYWVYFSVLLLFFKKVKRYSFTILLLVLSFLLLLFTYQGIHSDWRTYRLFYKKATAIGNSFFEKGFDFLLFLANRVGFFQFVLVFVLLSFLLLILILYDNKFFNKNEFFILVFSFYCAFLPLYFGALRQATASNFLLISLIYFYKKKYIRSLFFIFLSILFHNSSILIYAIFICFEIYCHFTRNFKYNKFVVITLFIVIGMYFVFYAKVEQLFIALDMAYRLGDADNCTSNSTKDLFILVERIIFIFFSFTLYKAYKVTRHVLSFLLRIYFGGNFFYCIFYSLARNLAGRTLAFYRYLDVYIMYMALRIIIPKILYVNARKVYPVQEEYLNNVALLLCIFYSLVKYYFTVATSGVF